MAIINCPECGKEISDKAEKCIYCGFPINSENCIPQNDISKNNLKNNFIQIKLLNKKKIITIICISIFIIATIISIIYFNVQKLSVEELNLSKWKLKEEGSVLDSYEGLITSNETSPFIAVIGKHEDSDATPSFVYMENGEGTIHTSVSSDDDPSIKYTPIGYIKGASIDNTNIKKISTEDIEYEDLSYDTNCTISIDIEMKTKQSGFLFVEIENDLNNNIAQNVIIIITNGKGKYSYNLENLPLKSRGVEVNVIPKLFCKAKNIRKSDYIIDTPLSVEKEGGTVVEYFEGEEKVTFNEYENGIIIYTEELLEGGYKKDRNIIKGKIVPLKDKQCNISTWLLAYS